MIPWRTWRAVKAAESHGEEVATQSDIAHVKRSTLRIAAWGIFLLVVVAIAGFGLQAYLAAKADERRDEDFQALCESMKYTAAFNAANLRERSAADARTSALLRGVAAGETITPASARLLNGVATSFDRAGLFAAVVAGVKEDLARTSCDNLPPPLRRSPEQLRIEISTRIDAALAEQAREREQSERTP